jgi:hypothetical protein
VKHTGLLRDRLGAADAPLVEAAADALLTLYGFPNGLPAIFPPDPAVAAARAEEMEGRLDPDRVWLRGAPFPAESPSPSETTEACWRRLVRGSPSPEPLRAEVPDGFFTGFPSLESVCGE